MSSIAAHVRLPTPGLAIRPAQAADDVFCRCLSDATLRAMFASMGLPEPLLATLLAQQFEAQRIGYRRSFPAAEYFVITEREVAVGRVVVTIDPAEAGLCDGSDVDGEAAARSWGNRALRIVDIALLPAAQGRGIGREVIAGLVGAAEAIGLRRLTLSVQSSNDRARSLYLRLGFIETEGEGYLHMTRRLG
ncbi:GNAT family N-acetyltransferase [Rhodopseudomonas palustris]|uniref:GNAT family N-acetyltransferase n=1 Tax=Rhodopseudomonas palustris TaxID=1076 RepID=UPI00115C7ADB|nr:GNAT family N-acetyltransferase [Rhodopseudomonas palustris]QDL97782.1 GNAT family N-acetyltransferase [Rhodopseudomonas palustris]